MAIVASLFDSDSEATAALDALADSKFHDIDTRVFNGDVPDEVGEARVLAIPSASTNSAGVVPSAVLDNWVTELDNEDLSDYFIDEVKKGHAVLVVAKVDEDDAADLEQFFKDHDGRVSEKA
jgi:hypothetical protein